MRTPSGPCQQICCEGGVQSRCRPIPQFPTNLRARFTETRRVSFKGLSCQNILDRFGLRSGVPAAVALQNALYEPRMAEIILFVCTRCGRNTNHDVLVVSLNEDADEPSWYERYETLKCRGCENVSLRRTEGFNSEPPIVTSYGKQYNQASEEPAWLLTPLARLFADNTYEVPQIICDIMLEVYTAFKNNSFRLCAMGIRAALENIMIDKVGDHQNFTRNVDEFERAGFLSIRQRTVIDSILDAGHAAIHRGWEPTKEDIDTLLDVTKSVIETVYIHEARGKRLDSAVPKRAKPKRP